jgi:type I restriction enzyme, S subunit
MEKPDIAKMEQWKVSGKQEKKLIKSKKYKEPEPLTEEQLEKLPKLSKDWKWVSHSEISIINPPKPDGDESVEVSFLAMLAVEEETGRYSLSETRKLGEVRKGYTGFIEGDVIFAKITPCMENGKVAYLEKLVNGIGFGSTEFHVSRPTSYVFGKYLFHYLVQQKFRKEAKRNMTGSAGQLRVPSNYFAEQPFPLAPLPEQRAIVSKIEQLFSELDNGITNLKLAQEQLKVYRQAVLKKAFEGELTRKWREQQTDLPDAGDLLEQIKRENEKAAKTGKKLLKINHLNEIELTELPRLPEGWGWERLEGIGYWTGGGTPSKQNYSYWNNGDVLWVSPKDMKTKLIVDTEDKITTDSIEKSSAKWIVKDSILFVVRSGIIRRILPIALAGKNLTTNQDLQSLTLFWGDKDYVFWYCQANEQIIRDKCAKDGTTVDNIEVPRLKSYPIAICSLPEQQAIVKEIETRLSVCDKIEQDIQGNLERSEALRQSILKKAFEGKLLNEKELAEVRKAEDWEPAEVLLERIKAEKTRK